MVKNRNIDKRIIFNNTNKNGTEKEIYNKQNINWVEAEKDDGNRLDIKTIQLHKLVKNRNIDNIYICTHTHTHTHIYIYMCVCVCVCVHEIK